MSGIFCTSEKIGLALTKVSNAQERLRTETKLKTIHYCIIMEIIHKQSSKSKFNPDFGSAMQIHQTVKTD